MKRPNAFQLAAGLLVLAIVCGLGITAIRLDRQRKEAALELETLRQTVATLTSEKAALSDALMRPAADRMLVHENDLAELRGHGLADPVVDITRDLSSHRDLIPFGGVLGGTMSFSDSKSWVMTDKWVLAYFEDGHISGWALLEYEVKDGTITWKRVAAYLN